MIIEIQGLVKHYGAVKAVDDVSFAVEEGEIFGLLDPNGAGKTTLMEILCGLRKFDHGKVTINGLRAQANEITIPPHDSNRIFFP
jgi:ABC-2 type transport system ATP-binding protein